MSGANGREILVFTILLILEICGQKLFVFSLKMPHQWGGVRQHVAREGEAAKASPFDSTQGHVSFDFAQDPEVLEGRRRMAGLVLMLWLPVPVLSRVFFVSLCLSGDNTVDPASP